jgi:hypothetical protein
MYRYPSTPYIVQLYKFHKGLGLLKVDPYSLFTDWDPALPKALDPDQTPDPEAIPGYFRSSLIFILFLVILNF